ncbi:hypothetical protein B0H21DRAFT_82174 [Amylocystis lapponica]|nr:hypothetical protein B0H21DRAFT_82174 [Amylocystis lapponica]
MHTSIAADHIPPPDIRLASLNPPEMQRGHSVRELPQVLLRMKTCQWRAEDIIALTQAPIYDTLPRALIPWTLKYKPPLMLYGWPVDFTRLLHIAEARNQVFFENIVNHVGDVNGTAEGIQEIHSQEVDKSFTVQYLVRALGKELSPCPPIGLRLSLVINHPNMVIVSVYSNYDLVNPTSDEFVERLGVALGEEERPRWYLNAELYHWRVHESLT